MTKVVFRKFKTKPSKKRGSATTLDHFEKTHVDSVVHYDEASLHR